MKIWTADNFGCVANSTNPLRTQHSAQQWLGSATLVGKLGQGSAGTDTSPWDISPTQPFAGLTRDHTCSVAPSCERDEVAGFELVHDRGRGRVRSIGLCTITELAVGVGAPAQHPRVAHQGTGVAVTEGELVDRWTTRWRGLADGWARLHGWLGPWLCERGDRLWWAAAHKGQEGRRQAGADERDLWRGSSHPSEYCGFVVV